MFEILCPRAYKRLGTDDAARADAVAKRLHTKISPIKNYLRSLRVYTSGQGLSYCAISSTLSKDTIRSRGSKLFTALEH